MTHWCRDIPRDEAVRASEDGRKGPLPTLEQAISAVTERRPPEPRGGGNVTGGMRTERVTLEVTHDLDAPLGDWIVQVIDESLGFDESVRVVDNTAERITQALTADRFASAVAEADTLRARVVELESAAKLAPAANADGKSNHAAPAASGSAGSYWMVRWPEGGDHDIDEELFPDEQTARDMAELEEGAVVVELVERQAASGAAGTHATLFEADMPLNFQYAEDSFFPPNVHGFLRQGVGFRVVAAPQPAPGWLTAEEREPVEWFCGSPKAISTEQCDRWKDALRALLARSSPPEVVLEDFTPDAIRNLDTKYLAGWDQCMALAKRAILAAGVTMKEVGK